MGITTTHIVQQATYFSQQHLKSVIGLKLMD